MLQIPEQGSQYVTKACTRLSMSYRHLNQTVKVLQALEPDCQHTANLCTRLSRYYRHLHWGGQYNPNTCTALSRCHKRFHQAAKMLETSAPDCRGATDT